MASNRRATALNTLNMAMALAISLQAIVCAQEQFDANSRFSVPQLQRTRRPFRLLPRPTTTTLAPPNYDERPNLVQQTNSDEQQSDYESFDGGNNRNATAIYELLQPLLASFFARNDNKTASHATASFSKSSYNYTTRTIFLHNRLMSLLKNKNEYFYLQTAQHINDINVGEAAQFIASNLDRLREEFAMPMPLRAVFQALYVVVFVVAIVGNCLVIVVYRVARQWRQEISVFHVNLACADILLAAFCVPFTAQQVLDHFWPWPRLLCPIVLFLQPLSVFVSVYTLIAIGFDRLKFVRQPLQPRISSGFHGKMVMFCIWCGCSVLAGVQVTFYQVEAYRPAFSRQSNNMVNDRDLCECKVHKFGR